MVTSLKFDSHLGERFALFAWIKAFYKWWKMFLFYRKSSLRSKDIYIFLLIFWSKMDGLEDRSIAEFMASQPD